MEILIKCQGVDNEYVSITPDRLPSNPYDVIYLLKVEYAPRSAWLDVASAYFGRGDWETGITILEQATSDDVETILKSVEEPAPACSRLELLAALGGAHIMLADTQMTDPPQREQTLLKARAVFSLADKIDFDASSIWVARGWADFLAGKVSSAKDWFDNARGKQVVLGSIGLAALQLNRPRAADAPKGTTTRPDADLIKTDPVVLLTTALRARRCPPGVWTGLGYALFREGNFGHARDVACRAVKAVQHAGPAERREALYLLSLVESADLRSTSPEIIAAALREAYVECAGQSDPRILTMLADLHFKCGEFEKAEGFGREAVARAHDSMTASVGSMYAGVQKNTHVQALFQYARALHHRNNPGDALKAFEQVKSIVDGPDGASLKVNPGFYLRFGMLKLSTNRKEDESIAQECLEKVIKINGERSFIAMRALGFLLGRRYLSNLRPGKTRGGEALQRAIKLLKDGMDNDEAGSDDIPSQLIYAALTEEASPSVSLASYKKAIAASEKRNIAVDPEVWSNMAALLARVGKHDEAKKLLDDHADKEFEAQCPTLLYNKARVAEIRGDGELAVSLFRKISSTEPHHMEAQIRLGSIAQSRGNLDEAETLFKKVMSDPSSRSIAAAYLSNLYTSQKKFKEAQKILEQNRNDCDYLTLSFAQFFHRFLDSVGSAERRKKFLINYVGTPVLSVLKKSKDNAFAANAAGVYLAESGMIEEAHHAFTSAVSCSAAAPTARVNLAHTHIYIGHKMAKSATDFTGRPDLRVLATAKVHFEQAERLYGKQLKESQGAIDAKGYTSRIELMHYQGCAQFESREYNTAVKTFQKVLMFAPTSNIAWYNLGLSLYENAIMRIKGSKDYKEVLAAKTELETSRRCFHRSLKLERKHTDPVAHTKFDSRLSEHWYNFVRQETKRHDVTLVNARNEAEDREQRKRETEAKIAEILRKKEEEKQKRKMKEEEQQKKMEMAACEAAQKLVEAEKRELEERLLREQRNSKREKSYDSDEGERPAPKAKKRKRKTEADTDEEGGKKKKASKKSRSRIVRAGGDSSSDEYPEDLDAEMNAMLTKEEGRPRVSDSPKPDDNPREQNGLEADAMAKKRDRESESEDEVKPVKIAQVDNDD